MRDRIRSCDLGDGTRREESSRVSPGPSSVMHLLDGKEAQSVTRWLGQHMQLTIEALARSLGKLKRLSTKTLLERRYEKFRRIGQFIEPPSVGADS